jgi:hypothetical protein
MAVGQVYTERFVASDAHTGTLSWTVPGGKRAILKQLDVFNGGSATATVYVAVAGVTFAVASGLAQNARWTWEGMHALYAHEAIGLNVIAGAASVVVSGYVFDDPTRP